MMGTAQGAALVEGAVVLYLNKFTNSSRVPVRQGLYGYGEAAGVSSARVGKAGQHSHTGPQVGRARAGRFSVRRQIRDRRPLVLRLAPTS